MQKLAIDDFFGSIKKFEWVSHILLDADREAGIESCFSCEVEFHYSNEIENFNDVLEKFKAQSNTVKSRANDTYSSENIVNNGFGEKTKRD